MSDEMIHHHITEETLNALIKMSWLGRCDETTKGIENEINYITKKIKRSLQWD